MIACFAVYIVMLLVALIPNVWTLFGALFLFCPSMFLAHSVAITAANQGITRNVGVVNGLYLAFYYSGGVLGSYLPGFVYQRFGWSSFVSILLLVAVVGPTCDRELQAPRPERLSRRGGPNTRCGTIKKTITRHEGLCVHRAGLKRLSVVSQSTDDL